MAAPGTYTDPNNPLHAVGGLTFGRTNANAISAMNNPAAARQALLRAKQRAQMGMGAAPLSNEEMYAGGPMPSAGFGSGDSRYGGGGNTQRDVRIGNVPGTMSPPSPTAGGMGASGGLASLYASNTTDPTTGLPVAPGAFDRLQLGKTLQGKGDFEGDAAVNSYYDAKNSGNPAAIGASRANIIGLKSGRQFLQGQQQQTPPAQPFGAFPQGPAFDPNNGIGFRAMGGPTMPQKPYMVGEKGPEEFVGENGQKQMIGMNGPEIGSFNEPGKVIPNDELPPRMQLMRHKAMGMGMKGVTHAAGGADVKPWWQRPLFPEKAPINSIIGAPGRLAQRTNRVLESPFVAPTEPIVPNSPADRLLPENYGPSGVAPLPSELLQGDEYTSGGIPGLAPLPHVEPEWDTQPVDPFAQGPAWDVDAEVARAAAQNPQPLPPLAPLSNLDLMHQPMSLSDSMYQHGATELPSANPLTRSFQVQLPDSTPQGNSTGIASVTTAPRTRETLIEGIPASEYFKRAANRQGIANRFATPDSDSAAPALNARMVRNNRRNRLGLAMGR